jgi:hypothetical protein
VTERQVKLARHALGFPNKKNESYRNHFCIGKGGDGYEDWMDLVSQGLAVRSTGPHWGGDDMFHLTLSGALQVRTPKEHLSREDAERMRRMVPDEKGAQPQGRSTEASTQP